MAYKEPSSNIFFVPTALFAVIGAYQLGKRSSYQLGKRSSNKKIEKTSNCSEMVPSAGSRLFLTSLLSFSCFSWSSTAFSPPRCESIITKDQRRNELQTPVCAARKDDELERSIDTKELKDVKTNESMNSLKETKSNESDAAKVESNERKGGPDESLLDSITMQPIGKISSVYRLCVGTPRQGLLAPNSRGRLDLYPNRIASDSILDLDKFSHMWVVFIFHLNSNAKSVEKSKQSVEKGKVVKRQFPSKIKPPALGGKRVGIFATRSPHRPNPIGFSLCKIDKIVIPPKKKHQKAGETPYHVYVSGLDLVDGTPVLDIKPYVPHYDSVGYMHEEGLGVEKEEARLPLWVSDGLGASQLLDCV